LGCMAGRGPKVVRFGNFELDQRTSELRKHGLKVKLQQKPLQVLNLLLERRGEIVSREELQRDLWPGGVIVDFDHSLNTAIKKLRDALGDTAAAPRYVATVDRQGYRFAADVQEIPTSGDIGQPRQTVTSAAAAAPALPQPTTHRSTIRGWPWRLAATLLLLAGGSYLGWKSFGHREPPAARRVMLAVLPFQNLTGDSAQEYFGEGLTEEMITQLGRIDPQRFGVIARNSVIAYKKGSDLGRVARELGVDYVLEGSVRRDSEAVRIAAQLIRTEDQTQVWARQYDRQLTSLLSVQGEIAQEVSDEIELTLGKQPEPASARSSGPTSPSSYEAYDIYLKGRYFWNKRSPYFQQAAQYFQRAIDKDPNYARAYAGLADTSALLSIWQEAPQEEFMPKARKAALKALQLDETLPEAHASLALIAESYDYDWQTAEKEYRRAIQLDPSYATAHQWYAECLSWQGRFNEALAESERARQLDPLSLIIATDHAAILYFARHYDRAIEQAHAVNEMDPNLHRAHGIAINAEVQAGRFTQALADIARLRHLSGSDLDVWAWDAEVCTYARWGRQAEARRALARLKQSLRPSDPHTTLLLIQALVCTDQKDQAIGLLQKAYSEHSNVVLGLKVDPVYDPLRSDPRFIELLRRVGFSQ
jgi:TolB-like protein/DNA-binding winged helix-turn-helix (wHTH) protein/Tfp pilus assembly protein PilF